MRILVLTPRYSLSGVPLAQIRFAKALSDIGHEVSIVIGTLNAGYKAPTIDGVDIIILKKNRVIKMIGSIIRIVNMKKPEIIFSAEDHLNILLLICSYFFIKKPLISCSSRVTPYDTYSNVPFTKRWVLKILMHILMNRADILSCVSKEMVGQYRQIFKNSKHQAIYNIVEKVNKNKPSFNRDDESWFNEARKVVIGAGMLAPWKGFSDLIEAFLLIPRELDLKLIIIGDGPLKSDLQRLIKINNAEKFIKLRGYVDNSYDFFERADIFVLSSHVEGLPNVLVEALISGCSIVSTDCRTGPKEVLRNGEFGKIVPVGDLNLIAKAIIELDQKPFDSNKIKEAIEPFSRESVIESHRIALKINERDFYPKRK